MLRLLLGTPVALRCGGCLAVVRVGLVCGVSTGHPGGLRDEALEVFAVEHGQALARVEDEGDPGRLQLGGVLDKLTNSDKDKTIFVRGDKVVEYGRLMEVMDTLRGAGYLKIGLVGLETVGAK